MQKLLKLTLVFWIISRFRKVLIKIAFFITIVAYKLKVVILRLLNFNLLVLLALIIEVLELYSFLSYLPPYYLFFFFFFAFSEVFILCSKNGKLFDNLNRIPLITFSWTFLSYFFRFFSFISVAFYF